MRIIGGKFKGKKLYLPKDKITRPLKDMVKESIFNLLKHSNKVKVNLEKSDILDLFSGSGSFGLECLSRGAKSVYFFENYHEAIKILKKNLLTLKDNKNYQIFEDDCFVFFNSKNLVSKKFDIIFIDPPYKELKINQLIEKIIEKNILKENGLIIIHRHKKDSIELSGKIEVLDSRIYGISQVYLVGIGSN
jgi:16S rRNA (guanine966-N2)-methyltransferase